MKVLVYVRLFFRRLSYNTFGKRYTWRLPWNYKRWILWTRRFAQVVYFIAFFHLIVVLLSLLQFFPTIFRVFGFDFLVIKQRVSRFGGERFTQLFFKLARLS